MKSIFEFILISAFQPQDRQAEPESHDVQKFLAFFIENLLKQYLVLCVYRGGRNIEESAKPNQCKMWPS